MTTEESLAAFRSIADLWSEGHQFRLTTWVALKRESDWILRFGLTAYSPRQLEVIPVEVKTQHIWAGRRIDRVPENEIADDLNKLLDHPETVRLGRSSLNLALPDPPYVVDAYHNPAGIERFRGAERLPALEISVSQQSNLWSPSNAAIDFELKSFTKPYQGLPDLLGELGVPLDEYGLFNNPKVEIIISPPLTFRPTSTLDGGTLRVFVESVQGISRSDILLGVKAYGADRAVSRFSVGGDELVWQDVENLIEGSIEIEQGDTPMAVLHLSYRGAFCGQWVVQDERFPMNLRLRIHNALDESDAFKTRFFHKERPDAFEDQVALLLELLGFTTFKYGGTVSLSDAPDIVATSTEGHVFVIECTTGDINRQGKLHKLHARSKRIFANLAATGSAPHGVVPLMVTNADRTDTAAHWGIAAGYKIGLICREELTLLLDRLPAPPTPQEFHEAALASVPSTKNGPESAEPDLFTR